MGHGSRFPHLDAKFEQLGMEFGFVASVPHLDENLVRQEENKSTLFNGVSSTNLLKIWVFKRK